MHPCPIHKTRISKNYNDEEKQAYDNRITEDLEKAGYLVARMWGHEILTAKERRKYYNDINNAKRKAKNEERKKLAVA